MVLMLVFARDVLEVPARGFGMLMTASGFGATMSVLTLASARPARPWPVILGTYAGFVTLLAAFAFSTVYGLSLVFMVGRSGAMTAHLSAINTTIQSLVPDELRGARDEPLHPGVLRDRPRSPSVDSVETLFQNQRNDPPG